jgi:hypothetical protein
MTHRMVLFTGAAISLIDSVYLPLHLPGVNFKSILYGLPRVSHFVPPDPFPSITTDPAHYLQVGNQDFANYVDANLHVTHINNEKDPVPIVPGQFLGYHHPSGEVHIAVPGTWESCPGMFSTDIFKFRSFLQTNLAFHLTGQDNPSTLCIVGDVPNVFESDESDHDGPYDGITMGC